MRVTGNYVAVLTFLKFRLYPNLAQERAMMRTIEACKNLWNCALAQRQRRWREERKSTSYVFQQSMMKELRAHDPTLHVVYAQVGQDVLRRLDRAFKNFFAHRSNYPKFRIRSDSGSFTYPQAYNGSVAIRPDSSQVILSKVGAVKAVIHRPLPKDALLKTCTIVREPCGEWYACLCYENTVPTFQPTELGVREFKSPAGIDLGLGAIITTSDGEVVPRPRFLRKTEKRIVCLQKKFSRKRKDSKNWWKAKKRVAITHAKVARQRADFNHKLSSMLAKKHDLIGLEKLRLDNMVRNHSLAKSIRDAGWGQLARFVSYKAKANKGVVVLVEPAYSTQECAFCGTRNEIPLSTRELVCRGCGRSLQRDLNAAKVILKRALLLLGQGMPKVTPEEMEGTPARPTGPKAPVVEPGTPNQLKRAKGVPPIGYGLWISSLQKQERTVGVATTPSMDPL